MASELPSWVRAGTPLRSKTDHSLTKAIRNIHPSYDSGRKGEQIRRPATMGDIVWYTSDTHSDVQYLLDFYEPFPTERCRYCYGR